MTIFCYFNGKGPEFPLFSKFEVRWGRLNSGQLKSPSVLITFVFCRTHTILVACHWGKGRWYSPHFIGRESWDCKFRSLGRNNSRSKSSSLASVQVFFLKCSILFPPLLFRCLGNFSLESWSFEIVGFYNSKFLWLWYEMSIVLDFPSCSSTFSSFRNSAMEVTPSARELRTPAQLREEWYQDLFGGCQFTVCRDTGPRAFDFNLPISKHLFNPLTSVSLTFLT